MNTRDKNMEFIINNPYTHFVTFRTFDVFFYHFQLFTIFIKIFPYLLLERVALM